MLNQTNFAKIINNSVFPSHEKQELAAALPVLGEFAGNQLYAWLNARVSLDEEERAYYLKFVQLVVSIMSNLERGDAIAVKKSLEAAMQDPNYDFGKMLLPTCYDIRVYINNHPNQNLEVALEAALFCEATHIRFVSEDELKNIINQDALYFTATLDDFLGNIRYLYYVASPTYDGGIWARQFLPMLVENQELLGNKIVVGQQEFAPTVEHWLKEYDLFAGKPGPQRQALDRLHFVQNNPNSKALSKEDQGVLLKLCELYDWLSDPYVTETEVSEFEDIAPATSRPGYMAEAPGVLGSAILEADTGPQDPNVQGVLVQTPIGVSKSGLEMSGRTPSVSEQPKAPVFVGKVAQKPVSVASSNKQQIPKPSKSPEPPQEAGLTNLPKPRTLPPLVPPPMPKKSPVASQKTSAPLNMDRIKAEVEKKRDEVQGGIDKKLDELKKKE